MATRLKEVDAVLVGVGLVGTMLGRELTKAGLKVVGLERGNAQFTVPDFQGPHMHDELRYSVRKAFMQDNTKEAMTFRNNVNQVALPIRRWESFLPGTARSADRFARMSWNLSAAAKEKDPWLATATTFSLIRAISVPLGISDKEHPNIASTIWRTVSDTGAKRYYFESAYNPAIFWVDLDKLKLEAGAKPMKLDLSGKPILAGEVSDSFTPAEPFRFLSR